MSWPLGCTEAGNRFLQSSLSGHPAWMAQVRLESNHVSRTSVSPTHSVPPHSQVSWMGVTLGSTGRFSGFASWIFPHPLQYQAGMGVANTLCLLRTQSQSRPVAQSMSLWRIQSGNHLISFAVRTTSSVRLMVLMNHWSVVTTSIGVSHLQQAPTSCSMLSTPRRRLASSRSATMSFLASSTPIPEYFPAASVNIPFPSMSLITGSLYRATATTSALSP